MVEEKTENKDKVSGYDKKYKDNNREKINKLSKERRRAYYLLNKLKIIEQSKKYRETG
jgi:hypothetical protein